jgi:outer membrane receptor for ferrienterochelin and colicins
MDARVRSVLLTALLVATPGAQVAAQRGAIAGWVTNATTLDPVPLAKISIVGGGPPAEVISESDGSFELRLPAGTYDLLVEAGDFAPKRFDRIRVLGGLTTTKNLPLESQGYRLAGFIVTASRGALDTEIGTPASGHAASRAPDTEITAPSSSHSVSSVEIAQRPAPSPVEHLRESPGVDIGTLGIQASNVVLRGFDNIFSGALHMLTDYRLAGLPALRANFMHFLPLNDLDLERIEVILGPGSALYGPNTANGVVHLITKSPLESPGTTVSLGAGEQSIWQGAFRSAFKVNEDFAVKVSGQLFRGQEWPYVDPAELDARQKADADPPQCVGDRVSLGASDEEAGTACLRTGNRNYGIRRYGLEARADWRYSPRGTLVGTYGVTDDGSIELTGLGAAQTDQWIYQFVQGRFTYDRWAIQAYFNFNDSGDNAYKLRDGMSLIDRSWLGVVQVQNGFSVADGRQDFTYGWDYFATRPRSEKTIYGDYEGGTNIQEWGVYLQSRTSLSAKVDLVAAGRVDAHSILPERIFSPRLALVLKPNASNAVRFAYNRAVETPTALNYFLDLGAGAAPGLPGDLGYTFRAFGTGRSGFGWQKADGSLHGMRSPFNYGDPGGDLPADAATLWRMGLSWASVSRRLPQDALALLQGLTPGASDIGVLVREASSDAAQPLTGLTLADVPPVREGYTESFEAGWSGVLKNALRVSVDVYYMTQHDFVSPLTAESPFLFLDAAGLGRWLGSAYVPARIEDLVQRLGLSREAATAQAAQEAGALAAGMGQIPLAVALSDAPEMANGGADIIVTYRNVGDLSLWGADAALEWLLARKWALRATYSHVSRDWFAIEGSEPLALNAPKDKGTLGITYRDEAQGLSASARVRYTGDFPFLSTVYDGTACLPDRNATVEACIAARALVDVTLGYKVPRTRATLQLGVNNLLNTPYRSFVGVPAARRLAMARVRYDFF